MRWRKGLAGMGVSSLHKLSELSRSQSGETVLSSPPSLPAGLGSTAALAL